MVVPPSSYTDHYPPKDLPEQADLPEVLTGPTATLPFTAKTEYDDQYFAKPRMARPVDPLTFTPKAQPWLLSETTNQAFYKAPAIGGGTGSPSGTARETRPAMGPPGQMPSIWDTTYRREFIPKDAPGRQPVGEPEPRPAMPWLAGDTTYRDHYVPKDLALQPVLGEGDGMPFPFDGTTEYKAQYVPKEGYPVVPPLTGILSPDGLQLPLPRRSLGVEFWHKGRTNQYFVLIPRTIDLPATAKQVFTTVNDNQEQACILVLYGDDPVASNNLLLGQFDIVNIPPAPKDVPRIEVTFHLDRTNFLTAEARDLDTERHKLWQQRGRIVVIKA